jgi:hypothetical protein
LKNDYCVRYNWSIRICVGVASFLTQWNVFLACHPEVISLSSIHKSTADDNIKPLHSLRHSM